MQDEAEEERTKSEGAASEQVVSFYPQTLKKAQTFELNYIMESEQVLTWSKHTK